MPDTIGRSEPDTLAAVSPARRSKPTKQVRVKVALLLTHSEVERLESRDAGEVRPVANYVAWVIEQHLGAKPRKAKPRDADPSEERMAYDVGPFLSIPERRELEQRATAERRSVSGYVTRLVVDVI